MTSALRREVFNLPNYLTMVRILAIPVVVWLLCWHVLRSILGCEHLVLVTRVLFLGLGIAIVLLVVVRAILWMGLFVGDEHQVLA